MDRKAEVESTFKNFVHDMWEWERSCDRLAKNELGPDASIREWGAYCLRVRNEVLRKYCIDSVTAANLVMGTPHHYTPTRETIVSVSLSEDQSTAMIQTEARNKKEKFYFGFSWKYQLTWDGTQWRIGKRWLRRRSESKFSAVPII